MAVGPGHDLRPDTIESGGAAKKADVIKTHHNRVPEIDALIERGLVVEPLADLYKDEVRAVGGGWASRRTWWRQPFPGPGLGVRLLCHDGEDDDADMRAKAAQQTTLIGATVSVPPLKSVGCQGDARTYRISASSAAITDGTGICRETRRRRS